MFRFFFIFLCVLININCCFASINNFLYFGMESNSIKNYFEINSLPVNVMVRNFLLNKYNFSNLNISLNNKMGNLAKCFLFSLKEIKISDFKFINGFSFFIGYKINDLFDITFGYGYFFNNIDITLANSNKFLKHNLINNFIAKYKYSYSSLWVDFVKLFMIEKRVYFLYFFGFECAINRFQILSNSLYDFCDKNIINELCNKKNIKTFNSYEYRKNKDYFIPYTILYSKNLLKNINKKNLNINFIDNLNYFSKRKGFRIGAGLKCVVSSNINMNINFKYHMFINNYKCFNVFSKYLLSSNFSIIYKV